MIVAAIVVPVAAVVVLVLPQFQLNGQVIPVDGAPHSITVPLDAEYAVFAETRSKAGAPSCVLTGPDGASIPLREVSGTVTVNNRMVLRTFDTGGGELTARCSGGVYDEVVLGKYPDMGLLLGGIFGSLGFALIVGGSGSVLLIVTVARRS